MRPHFSNDIGDEVDKTVCKYAPELVKPIIANLSFSLKLIAAKILPQLPIGGNVPFDDIWDEIEGIMNDVPDAAPIMNNTQDDIE